MRRIKIQFWRVMDQHGPVDISSDLQGLFNRSGLTTDVSSDYFDWLKSVKQNSDSEIGLAVRVSKNNPDYADIAKNSITQLTIAAAGKGIGETVPFLHFRSFFLTVSNSHYRASSVAELIGGQIGRDIYLQPELTHDAWNRFERMTHIGSIELKLDAEQLRHRRSDPLARIFDDFAEPFTPATIDLRMSAGRRRGASLNHSKVRRLFENFRGEKVRGLKATGRSGDAQRPDVVDFIHEQIVCTVAVDGDPKDVLRCEKELNAALQEHRQDLLTRPLSTSPSGSHGGKAVGRGSAG